jgi:hypothetical protein
MYFGAYLLLNGEVLTKDSNGVVWPLLLSSYLKLEPVAVAA